MKETNLTRRERERLFRKREIIDAAVRLFAEKGYTSTTLDDIAATSEFGKGTLYNYFSGKEEIYSAIVDEVSKSLTEIFKEADQQSGSTVDFLRNYAESVYDYCLANKENFVLYVREIVEFTTDVFALHKEKIVKRRKSTRKRLIDRFSEGVKSGELVKNNPEKTADIFQYMIFPYVLFLISLPGKEPDAEKEVETILKLFFNGVLNNKYKSKR